MTTLLYQDDLESIEMDCKRCGHAYPTIGYYDEELEYYIEISRHYGLCTNCAPSCSSV